MFNICKNSGNSAHAICENAGVPYRSSCRRCRSDARGRKLVSAAPSGATPSAFWRRFRVPLPASVHSMATDDHVDARCPAAICPQGFAVGSGEKFRAVDNGEMAVPAVHLASGAVYYVPIISYHAFAPNTWAVSVHSIYTLTTGMDLSTHESTSLLPQSACK